MAAATGQLLQPTRLPPQYNLPATTLILGER